MHAMLKEQHHCDCSGMILNICSFKLSLLEGVDHTLHSSPIYISTKDNMAAVDDDWIYIK